MRNPERVERVDAKTILINQLIGFLMPWPDETITVGKVTESRAQGYFTVKLVKQKDRNGNIRVIGNQEASEQLLNSTAECLRQMKVQGVIRPTDKEKFAAIREKILEITKEAKSKIKNSKPSLT